MIPCLVTCPNKHITLYKIKNKMALLKRVKAKKIVCPRCGKFLEEFDQPTWSPAKQYFCDKGHVISIYPFNDNRYNISWSDKDFVNIGADLPLVVKDIEKGEICCPVSYEKDICNRKLKPLDDSELKPVKLSVAKTKKRLGDVWDKMGCPEPKVGSYDKNFNFHDTEFSRRNRVRVKALRKERLTKPAGTVITKATTKSYRVRNHQKPSQDEI